MGTREWGMEFNHKERKEHKKIIRFFMSSFVISVLFAALTIICNSQGIARFAERAAQRYSQGISRKGLPHVEARREVVRSQTTENDSIFFFTDKNGSLNQMNRSIHIGMLWEASPRPVAYGGLEGFTNANVVISAYNNLKPDFDALGLDEKLHPSLEYIPGYRVWRKIETPQNTARAGGGPRKNPPRPPPPPLVEAFGLLPLALIAALTLPFFGIEALALALVFWSLYNFAVCAGSACVAALPPIFAAVFLALAAGGVAFKQHAGLATPPSLKIRMRFPLAFWLSLAFFAFAAFGALSHGFIPPNALGVAGGKAKLLILNGGIPPDFFTAKHWSTLQPAYPPGLAAILAGCFISSGSCGEWLTQLVGCFFAAMCVHTMCRETSRPASLWIFASFCAPLTLMMSSLLYPETLMSFLLLAGWTRVREEDDALGWFLLGACGWVKMEGILFLPLAWALCRFGRGISARSIARLVLGLLLPLGWMAFARLRGAEVYDYAPLWQPDFNRALLAASKGLRLAFLEPWRYGFAHLAAIYFALPHVFAKRENTEGAHPRQRRETAQFWLACAFAAASAAAFAFIFSLSRAPDFEWHLLSLERLLWPPSLLLLFELARRRRRCAEENRTTNGHE